MQMKENVNNEVRKDSSILRFVKLQEARGPDNANITFSFFWSMPMSLTKKKNKITCYVSFIVYSLFLKHHISFTCTVLFINIQIQAVCRMIDA